MKSSQFILEVFASCSMRETETFFFLKRTCLMWMAIWNVILIFYFQRTFLLKFLLKIKLTFVLNCTFMIDSGLSITAPPWPNGYGIGLLNRGLRVRVPPEVNQIFLILYQFRDKYRYV